MQGWLNKRFEFVKIERDSEGKEKITPVFRLGTDIRRDILADCREWAPQLETVYSHPVYTPAPETRHKRI